MKTIIKIVAIIVSALVIAECFSVKVIASESIGCIPQDELADIGTPIWEEDYGTPICAYVPEDENELADLGTPIVKYDLEQAPQEYTRSEFRDMEELVMRSAEYGIIDQLAPVEFQPDKKITYGEFLVMVRNCLGEHRDNTKKQRTKAVKWFNSNYGKLGKLKTNSKLSWSEVKTIFTIILNDGQVSEVWKEGMDNLEKETKLMFPTFGGGKKLSKIEALYIVYATMTPFNPFGNGYDNIEID
jgi:hypothetical protein